MIGLSKWILIDDMDTNEAIRVSYMYRAFSFVIISGLYEKAIIHGTEANFQQWRRSIENPNTGYNPVSIHHIGAC